MIQKEKIQINNYILREKFNFTFIDLWMLVNEYKIDCIFYLGNKNWFSVTKGKFMISKHTESFLTKAYFIKIHINKEKSVNRISNISFLVRDIEKEKLKLDIDDKMTYFYKKDGEHQPKYDINISRDTKNNMFIIGQEIVDYDFIDDKIWNRINKIFDNVITRRDKISPEIFDGTKYTN